MLVRNRSPVAVNVKVVNEKEDKRKELQDAKVVLIVPPGGEGVYETTGDEAVYVQFVDVPVEEYYEFGSASDTVTITADWVEEQLSASPLHWAVLQRDTAAIQRLLSEAATDVDGRDANGSSALHYAARLGDVAAARLLLAAPGVVVDALDDQHDTPLHEAAQYNHTAFISLLVREYGADVHAKGNKDQHTPLHEAAQSGSLEAVQLLVETFGADVNAQAKNGWTAMMLACAKSNLEVVKYLIDEKGADVNAQTALMLACQEGKVEVVMYFIDEKGADVSAQDKWGRTALMRACAKGNVEVVKHLVERGVNMNFKSTDGDTALMMACKEGKVEVVKYLVEKGADLSAQNKYGYTALMHACYGGNVEVVKYLVEKGADMKARSESGETALMCACKEGKLEVVKYLVERGAEVNVQDKLKLGRTALMWACNEGNLEVVKYLVDEKGADVNVESLSGETALMWASKVGDLEVVKYLVEKGADVNTQDKWKDKTALMRACERSNLEVVKCLVEKGADMNAQDKFGSTVLIKACEEGKLEVVKHLVEEGADMNVQSEGGWTALMLACQKCNVEVVKYLVEKGADVNTQDKNGITALMWSCQQGKLEVLKCLVEKGADVNAQTKDGWSALMKACNEGNLEVATYLFEKGADVSAQDLKDGSTALMHACIRGNVEVVKYLVKKGAEVNVQAKDGSTALMHACIQGNVEVVKYLVEKGAEVNVQVKGETVLMKACIQGNLEVVKYLVEKEADVNARSKNGDTVLLNACNKGHWEVIKYLVEKGAEVNVQAKDGSTALMHACIQGNVEAVKYLVEKGEEVNVQDLDGRTALMWSCHGGNLEVVKYLVEKEADVNARSKNGDTALLNACNKDHWEVVKYLVEVGADVNAQNKNGETALMCASKVGKLEAVMYLIEKKANLKLQNKDGNTAIHIAAYENKYDVLQYLIQQRIDLEMVNSEGLTSLQYAIAMKIRSFKGHYSYTCFLLAKGGAAIRGQCDDAMMGLALDYWKDRRSKHLPITEIPSELFDANDEVRMRDFLRKAAMDVGDGEHIYRMRVMLLGQFMAGKSSLKNALLHNRSQLVHEENRTIGVDTFRWRMRVRLDESTNDIESYARVAELEDESNVEMSVWDFAGQEEYYQTHQIFTRSKKSIYVLVVNLERYDESSDASYSEDVGFWVDMLQGSIPGVDPVIVGTHIDRLDPAVVDRKCSDIIGRLKASEAEIMERYQRDIEDIENELRGEDSTDKQELRTRLNFLRFNRPVVPERVIPISNAEGIENVEQLERKLLELAVHPSRSIILPSTYSLFRTKLTGAESGLFHLPDLAAIAESCNEEKNLAGADRIEEGSTISILKLLDELGDVLFFDSKQLSGQDEQFQSVVINDPAYLLNLIKDIVHHQMKDLKKGPLSRIKFSLKEDKQEFITKGLLSRELLGEFEHWKSLGDRDQADMRFLLKKFDIMYSFDESTSLVPFYLPSDEQVSLEDWREENLANVTIGRDFEFESYVPPGLSARMVVRCSDSFMSSEFYHHSMYLQTNINDKKASLLFYQTLSETGYGGTVTITASAETAKEAWVVFGRILNEFLDLLNVFAGVSYCQCSLFGCKDSDQIFRSSGKDGKLRKQVDMAKKNNSKSICFLARNKVHPVLSAKDSKVSRTIDVPMELLLPLSDLQNYLDGHLLPNKDETFPMAEAVAELAKQRDMSGTKVGDLVCLRSSRMEGVVQEVVQEVSGSQLTVKVGSEMIENSLESEVESVKFNVFLSHAQLEAQNTCMTLNGRLARENLHCWYDMTSEDLTCSGMCRGVMKSNVFLLYLTKTYFTRWFCRLEFSAAVEARKKMLIVFETDNRFGGVNGEYIALLKEATKDYPEYFKWIDENCGEGIPYYRRGNFHEASIQSIVKHITKVENELQSDRMEIASSGEEENEEGRISPSVDRSAGPLAKKRKHSDTL